MACNTEPIAQPLAQALDDPRRRSLPDAELLACFLGQHDPSAFEAILQRHGAMVLDVCRSVLRNEADAEDAFQATFLILATRARSIRQPSQLGCWLHGVAYRTACKARAQVGQRRRHETNASRQECCEPRDLSWTEVRQIIHEELSTLPEPYRAPLVTCYLQGKTQDQAATLLGISSGTIKRRLERGRGLLRNRLIRRGVGSTALILAAGWPGSASARIKQALLAGTRDAAVSLAGGGPGAEALSPQVAFLTRKGFPLLLTNPVQTILAIVLATGLVGVVCLYGAVQARKQPRALPPSPRAIASSPRDQGAGRNLDQGQDPLPQGAVARLGTHRFRSDAWITQVQVVPGGKQILGFGKQCVILWDAASGKEVRRFQGPRWRKLEQGVTVSVRCESLAVSPDGKSLAVGTSTHAEVACPLLLFDLASGREMGSLPGQRSNGWSANPALTFVTPTLLVAAGAGGSCRVWDLTTRSEVCRLETPRDSFISQLLPGSSPDHVLVAGSKKGSGFWGAWDIRTGKVKYQHEGLPAGFVTLALSPDGKTVAVGLGMGEIGQEGSGNEVRLHSASNGKELRRWRTHKGPYPQRNSLAYSPDGTRIATGGADQRVRQWDQATGKQIGDPITPYPYANKVTYLNADTLVTHDAQHVLALWDTRTGKRRLRHDGAEAHVTALAYSPAGQYVACGGGGGDATIRIWEVATSKQVAHLKGDMLDLTCLKFSPDGKRIASADSGGVARVWDWRSGKQIQAFPEHKAWLHAVAFHPHGQQLATGDEAGTIRLWDLRSGKLQKELTGHTAHITDLIYTPDGLTLLSSGWDHTICSWDLETGKPDWSIKGNQAGDRTLPTGHTNVVTALALSPGGEWLYSGSSDHRICVWERRTGHLARVLRGEQRGYSNVRSIALSPDGKRLAAALGDDGQATFVHVWDVLSGEKLQVFRGHRGAVSKLAFSPDGNRLVSGSEDTTLLVWDLSRQKREAAPDVPGAEKWWENLGKTARTAYAAACRSARAGDVAVAHFETYLKPVQAVEKANIARWVKLLDSAKFEAREKASNELRKLGPASAAYLRTILGTSRSIEVKTRLRHILAQFATVDLRAARAVEVLEMIGTTRARQLLARTARGAEEAERTRAAKAALKRIEGREKTTEKKED